MRKARSLQEVFNKYCGRAEPDSCWLWTGPMTPRHYGRVRVQGRHLLAHRLSWEVHFGEIPDGLCVCHKCDNTRCVNPDHFFLGTQLENIQDMRNKKRDKFPVTKYGEEHSQAKLTADKVKFIRESPLGNRELAKLLGVTHSNISAIRLYKSWK